jgi:hypothetical protein
LYQSRFSPDLPCCSVARVKEQCCFNSTPDPFNSQTAKLSLKPPKIIESTTYVKKKQSGVLLFYYSGNRTTGQVWFHKKYKLLKMQAQNNKNAPSKNI